MVAKHRKWPWRGFRADARSPTSRFDAASTTEEGSTLSRTTAREAINAGYLGNFRDPVQRFVRAGPVCSEDVLVIERTLEEVSRQERTKAMIEGEQIG